MAFKEFCKKHWTFIIYNIFGFSATLLETFLYWLLYQKAGVSNVYATLFAWIITVVYAFFNNKIFVYRSRIWAIGTLLSEFWSFFGFRLVTGAFNILYMYVTVDLFSWHPVGMKLIAALVSGLMNYGLGKAVVFRKGMKQSTEEAAQANHAHANHTQSTHAQVTHAQATHTQEEPSQE